MYFGQQHLQHLCYSGFAPVTLSRRGFSAGSSKLTELLKAQTPTRPAGLSCWELPPSPDLPHGGQGRGDRGLPWVSASTLRLGIHPETAAKALGPPPHPHIGKRMLPWWCLLAKRDSKLCQAGSMAWTEAGK